MDRRTSYTIQTMRVKTFQRWFQVGGLRALTYAALAALTFSVVTPTFGYAQTTKDSARITQLEERVHKLEARMAHIETAAHPSDTMGMGQKHAPVMGKGMGSPMGSAPQGNTQGGMAQPSGQGAAPMMDDDSMEMPPADSGAQPPMGGSQGGGMGHM